MPNSLNSLQRYFAARFREEVELKKARPARRPAVTISRETGAGAVTLGEKLARYLEKNDNDRESVWLLFDRNLVDRVLDDHHLPAKLAEFMTEGNANELQSYVGEFLGLHPSLSTLVEKTNETIRKLAKKGNVILVGRGGNFVTASLKNTFHVRLICEKEKRIKRVQAFYELDYSKAETYTDKKDRERTQYVRKNFDKDPEAPLAYHLVLNTGLLSDEDCVRIIGDAVIAHAGRL